MSSRMEYHWPAPDRLRRSHELPVPHDSKSVNKSLGLLITLNGFQNSQIESGLLLDANLSHWHSKPLERLKVLRRCRSHYSRREYSIWSWNRCIRSSASSNAQPEWKTRGVLLANPLRKWAKARVHRERSLGHNRGTLDTSWLEGTSFILKTDQK